MTVVQNFINSVRNIRHGFLWLHSLGTTLCPPPKNRAVAESHSSTTTPQSGNKMWALLYRAFAKLQNSQKKKWIELTPPTPIQTFVFWNQSQTWTEHPFFRANKSRPGIEPYKVDALTAVPPFLSRQMMYMNSFKICCNNYTTRCPSSLD